MTTNLFEPYMIGEVVRVREMASEQAAVAIREIVGTLKLYLVSGESVFYMMNGKSEMYTLGYIDVGARGFSVVDVPAANPIVYAIDEGLRRIALVVGA